MDPPGRVVIVRAGRWARSLRAELAKVVSEVELADHAEPQRNDVLCTLVAIDALNRIERESLEVTLSAGQWARPCVLVVETRLDEALGSLIRAGASHLVAVDSNGPVCARALRQTLGLLSGTRPPTLPGLLEGPCMSETARVVRSRDRGGVATTVKSLARRCGAGPRIAGMVQTAADELISNALYNAPLDAEGRRRFAHLPRSVPVELEPGEVIEVGVSANRSGLALRVADPFGSLAPSRLRDVLPRGFGEATLEEKEGGAGLGLSWVFSFATHLRIIAYQHRRTEIVSLFDLSVPNRVRAGRPTSLDLFFDEPALEGFARMEALT